MFNYYQIQFPEDFLERYEKYRAKFGPPTAQEKVIEKTLEEEEEKNEVNKVHEVVTISFNPETGAGEVNRIDFKFKDNTEEYRVFKLLFERMNTKVSRYEVLVAAHFYEDGEDSDPTRKNAETEKINDIAKEIRRKTGLNKKQVVVNNGNLTLVVPKLTPKQG